MNKRPILSVYVILFFITYAQSTFSSNIGKLLNYEEIDIRDSVSGDYLYLPDFPSTQEVTVDKNNSIAIVDSGVADDHPQLKEYIVNQVDFTGEGFYDYLGHGTIVSLIYIRSLAQDSIFGINEAGSSIISVKVADKNGNINKEAMIKALQWIGKNNIHIANLSLGFEGNEEEHKDLCDTIKKQKNVLFVVAAGNSGPNVLNYPAACNAENVISVGATEKGKVAGYSGQGDIYSTGNVVLLDKKEILYREANSLSRQGLFDKALLKYDEILSSFPMPEAHFQKGIIYIHSKNYKNAFIELGQALKINPDFPEALEHMGLLYYFEGNNNKALSYLEEAAYLDPDSQRILSNLRKIKEMAKSKNNANKPPH
ncbi:MAG: S8 family serine peptidase [Burkholderiales bacterium]|nr:S8 family serine peptidase [Burkholderiales bacterium]MDR4517212.1 S8 family serine peptidase [Nitrosomonas sp.]